MLTERHWYQWFYLFCLPAIEEIATHETGVEQKPEGEVRRWLTRLDV